MRGIIFRPSAPAGGFVFMRKAYRVPARNRVFHLGTRTWVMGIINVTPDSFYPPSRSLNLSQALETARQMIHEGADILDLGGESTRPGADPVDQSEELERVLPVIEAIRGVSDIPISVDTRKSEVARAALDAGADLVNDVSGFHDDPAMASTLARFDAAAVAMHLRGRPKSMPALPPSGDILGEAQAYLRASLDKAAAAGLSRDRIIIDPGIGFGKSLGDNLRIIRNLDFLKELDCPILVGPSRKSFIGTILEEDVDGRLWGTAAAVACAVLAGAHMVRVHDVAAMKSVAKVADALAQAEHV